MLFRVAFAGLVAERGATRRIDRARLAANLRAYAQACARAGVSVEIAPDVAELVAAALTDADERRGRRSSTAFEAQRRIVRRFHERRAAGDKYEVALEIVSQEMNVSRKTLESWIALLKDV
jgi:type VI protein secretion system component VasF